MTGQKEEARRSQTEVRRLDGRYQNVTSIAAQAIIDAVPAAQSTVVVAAEDREVGRQIADVLRDQPGVSVRHGMTPQVMLDRHRDCDLLVLHCQTIGTDEFRLLAGLKRDFADLLIVTLCDSANARNARRAVDSGVDGLVFHNEVSSALVPTVTAVLAGQTVVPRKLRASLRKASLSFREKQILGMVVMGFTNGEIGARLFLAESTVKCHLSSAFSKMGVRSRNEAAAMILDPNGSLGTGILGITSGGIPTALESAPGAGRGASDTG